METDEGVYHATPQTKGKTAHKNIDEQISHDKNELQALSVYSENLGIMGKIDIYRVRERILIERKYQLLKIYRGQLYQIWAQYFCMREMGYPVEKLAFYEMSTNKMIPLDLPGETEFSELKNFIKRFKNYDPAIFAPENPNKCLHCIYCNLCDKTNSENVYE